MKGGPQVCADRLNVIHTPNKRVGSEILKVYPIKINGGTVAKIRTLVPYN